MTQRLWAALAALLSLVACAAPMGRQVSHSGASQDVALSHARLFVAVQTRLEPVAEAECARLNPRANCDFRILVDDRPGMPPNAFQTLDRRGRPILAVTAGLIARARNADELALVVAHEASHHIAGHLEELGRTATIGAETFGRIASGVEGATPASIREAEAIGAQIAIRSYSKEWELEADALGARVARAAGFDPVRGAEFFRRIPDPGNRFLGTHPSNAERIAAVRAAVGA